jgi:phosphoheptose isomerase
MPDPMQLFTDHLARHQAALADLQRNLPAVAAAADTIVAALRRGRRVLLCGNGGSAADAQHIAAELVGRFVAERRGLPSIALSTDTSILTAVGNDYGFDYVFARQVEALAEPGDVLVGISTSGNSANVIAAVEAAAKRGCRTIGLLGRDGGRLAAMVEQAVVVGVRDTAHIQECHIMIGHMWCAHVDACLAAEAEAAPRAGAAAGLCNEAEALERLRAARATGERVVMTNGCFDILHPGHIAYLEQARALGDRLLVAVNDDDSVRRLKGEGRPVNPLAHRLHMLAALGCVDWVVPFAEDTPERLICALLPDVLVKGGDYRPEEIAGGDCVRRAGGEVRVLGFVDGHSTTTLIERIRAGR